MGSLTSSAVALGREVHSLMTHEALKAFLTNPMNAATPAFHDPEYQSFYEEAVELERTPNLDELLGQARARGRVQIYGCQESISLWRRYTHDQLAQLTAIIGHSAFIKLASDKQLIFL